MNLLNEKADVDFCVLEDETGFYLKSRAYLLKQISYEFICELKD